MTTPVNLAPTFGAGYQGFSAGGIPLNAGKIYTYSAGSTTPLATYTTSAGSVQNANPIVLSADGRTPYEIWLTNASYRFDVKDANDNLIQTYDNLTGTIGLPIAAERGVCTSDFPGATLDLRLSAAIASLGAGGLIIIPATETSGAITTTNLTGGQVLLDLRNTGSAGAYYYYKGKTGSQVAFRVDWVGSPIGTNNAIAIYGNAENAGNGTNVIGVFGQVDSSSSCGTYGFNKSTGPGVQGDGSNLVNGALGILGTSGGMGTSGTPSIAVKGSGLGGYGVGGYFESDAGLPLWVKANGTGLSILGLFESSNTSGAWVELKSTDTGGKIFGMLSSGSATAVGPGKWALYSQSSNTYPVVVDYAALSNSFQIDSSSRSIFGAALIRKLTSPTYGTSIAINAALGNEFIVTVTDGVGFTVASPSNPVTGQSLRIRLKNTSGGAVGAVTWDTAYKMASWSSPANGFSRAIEFVYDGSNWVEASRNTADIPN